MDKAARTGVDKTEVDNAGVAKHEQRSLTYEYTYTRHSYAVSVSCT